MSGREGRGFETVAGATSSAIGGGFETVAGATSSAIGRGFETVADATSSASVGSGSSAVGSGFETVAGATSSASVSGGSSASGGAEPHARIRLIEDKCTSCMICARECPVWCIHIDSHTEADPDAPAQLTGRGMRERTINVLDRFAIDWALCMYCGICVEECPFDALEWRPEAMPAADSLARLTHEIEDLA